MSRSMSVRITERFMARPVNNCLTLSCNSRAMRRLSSSCNWSRRAESSRRLSLAASRSTVRCWTRCSSAPCARRNASVLRRLTSPIPTMSRETSKNKRIPTDCAVLRMRSESTGGTSQYCAPMTLRRMLRMEGPMPQYHAEKATAGKRVM